MQKTLTIRLLPAEAGNDQLIKNQIAAALAVTPASVNGFNLLKWSIDARGRQPHIIISLLAFINEPWYTRTLINFEFPDISRSKKQVIITGAGPAGLFAALRLISHGIKPVILERGKEVRARRRDLAILNREGEVNPESNYCFGEGGAGTYSDGKLYTRSTKRGDVDRILNLLVYFGADQKILYESHPHIGTNKLPQIIIAIRKKILDCGGEIRFENKMTDLAVEKENISAVRTNDGNWQKGNAFILATGHSARDIFQLLHSKKIQIEFKPFALGVRVEHPQEIIDSLQYNCLSRGPFLPPASYSLVHQVNGRGVFSFCMCPGGIIAPAATNQGELVVNGWSPSKRNNPYANSGIVVPVEKKDIPAFEKYGPLAGMYFQQSVEQKAFLAGQGKLKAPAQRLIDFTSNKVAADLPSCSYTPGISPYNLKELLPSFIYQGLQLGLIEFGKKMPGRHGSFRGYFTNDAVVLATESRTSSPVRMPRNPVTLQHSQISNLYPCGEGAGYAGGIVSAAMDGENVADQVHLKLS